MGLTREERKLLHTKRERVRSEGRRPEANSMNDGAQVIKVRCSINLLSIKVFYMRPD